MKTIQKSTTALLTAFLLVAGIGIVGADESHPFHPACGNFTEPSNFSHWIESYDDNDHQTYCETSPGELFISQPVFTNNFGQYFTVTNSDLWKPVSYSQQTGNIREVLIRFEYYFPSYQGVCFQNQTNVGTGLYNSPQYVLIGNANTNLSAKETFHVAISQWNDEITCDEWRTFSVPIKDFVNDFGSSFSGQSKTIGSIGFEAKNVYIRNVDIVGVTTVEVW